jgi:hypothetical protein
VRWRGSDAPAKAKKAKKGVTYREKLFLLREEREVGLYVLCCVRDYGRVLLLCVSVIMSVEIIALIFNIYIYILTCCVGGEREEINPPLSLSNILCVIVVCVLLWWWCMWWWCMREKERDILPPSIPVELPPS